MKQNQIYGINFTSKNFVGKSLHAEWSIDFSESSTRPEEEILLILPYT